MILAYGYGMLLTTCSMLLEERAELPYARFRDRLVLLPWVALESLGYRQMTVVWRIRGLWKYLRKRTEWGAMSRTGFKTELDPAETGGAG